MFSGHSLRVAEPLYRHNSNMAPLEDRAKLKIEERCITLLLRKLIKNEQNSMNLRHTIVTLQLLDTFQFNTMTDTLRFHENVIFTTVNVRRLAIM